MIIQEYFYFATSTLQRSALPAADATIVAMSLYTVIHNKAPLSKWFGNTTFLFACATLAALTVHSSVGWTGHLYSFAALLSFILSASTTNDIWFQVFHLLGVYRALCGSSEMWSRMVCSLLHGILVLVDLDFASKSLLKKAFQRLTFAQERHLLKLHKLRKLTVNDIWPLSKRFQLRTAHGELRYNTNESYYILRAILRMMWRPMIPIYIVGLLLQFIPIIRLKLTSQIMHNVDDLSNYSMYMVFVDMCRILVVELLTNAHNISQELLSMERKRASSALCLELFRLPLKRLGLKKKPKDNNGYAHINLLLNLPQTFQFLLNAVFSMALAGWVLYSQLGYSALIAIVLPYLIDLGFGGVKALFRGKADSSLYAKSGDNFSDIKDITRGIKAIKIFAWEKMFPSLELKSTSNSGNRPSWYTLLVQAILFMLDTITPIVSDIGKFVALYVYVNTLSLTNVSISNAQIVEIDVLFRNIQSEMGVVRFMISRFKDTLGLNSRLEAEFDDIRVNSLPHSDDTSDAGPLIEMNDCSFTWGSGNNAKNVFSDVTLNAGAGELVAIVGKTGSGKSSLLLAMCSEVEMTQGTGKSAGKIAYMEQQPWIMNDTLRANILFGREYDEEYYWKVLSACALTDDLEMWPKSDMTVIGENGIDISGGQRARLALARTVYSKADIYILDDPLSAVDAIVKRHILDNIILSTGLLGDKLRFVATNADNILPLCNQVVTVDDGHVSVKVQTPQVHTAFEFKVPSISEPDKVDNSGKHLQTTSVFDGKQMKVNSDVSTNAGTNTSNASKPQKQWSHWSNTLYAIRICGLPVVGSLLMTVIFDNVIQFVLIKYKLDALRANSSLSQARNGALLTYFGMNIVSNVSIKLVHDLQRCIRGILIGKKYTQGIVKILIDGLLSAPLSYFESEQDDVISSEYGSAIGTFTTYVPSFLTNTCSGVVFAFMLIYRIAVSAPELLLCVPLIVCMSQMLKASLDSLNDELHALSTKENRDYNENLYRTCGRTQMIRLFGVETYFTDNYIKSNENTTRLCEISASVSRLQRLLGHITSAILHSSTLYVYIVISKLGGYHIHSGDIAEFQQNFEALKKETDTITSFHKTTLYNLAKVNEFRNLVERDPEAPYVIDSCRPSAQWPPNGKVEFRDFSMKYRADLGYALKNVNLTINPGEKIGIVGRTGAGKSSLAKVLFRLIHENTSGSILIDGQDISEFGVGDYRPRLGMIPQEPSMFSGSIRRSLDPLYQYDIEDMWASLVKCNMAELVSSVSATDTISYIDREENVKGEQWQKAGLSRRVLLFLLNRMPDKLDLSNTLKPHGLHKLVQSCFGSFSSGQQQLFGLCRVIMRKRKIVVLDEATANVDLETDKSVQELIRKEFNGCTVLTIAHRLDTIMNSDRIIVMDKGTIAEVGTPQELLAKDGMFAQLVKTSEF